MLITVALFSLDNTLTYQGDWIATKPYVVNDVVTLSGIAYKCISGNTNQTPPNPTYWTQLPVIAASNVQSVIADLLRGSTSVYTWAYTAGVTPPANVALTDGQLKLELLSKDTKKLKGTYALKITIGILDATFFGSSAQTDVMVQDGCLQVNVLT